MRDSCKTVCFFKSKLLIEGLKVLLVLEYSSFDLIHRSNGWWDLSLLIREKTWFWRQASLKIKKKKKTAHVPSQTASFWYFGACVTKMWSETLQPVKLAASKPARFARWVKGAKLPSINTLFYYYYIIFNVLMSSFLPVHPLPYKTFLELCYPVQESTSSPQPLEFAVFYCHCIDRWQESWTVSLDLLGFKSPALLATSSGDYFTWVSKNILNTRKIASTENVGPFSQVPTGPGPTNKPSGEITMNKAWLQ